MAETSGLLYDFEVRNLEDIQRAKQVSAEFNLVYSKYVDLTKKAVASGAKVTQTVKNINQANKNLLTIYKQRIKTQQELIAVQKQLGNTSKNLSKEQIANIKSQAEAEHRLAGLTKDREKLIRKIAQAEKATGQFRTKTDTLTRFRNELSKVQKALKDTAADQLRLKTETDKLDPSVRKLLVDEQRLKTQLRELTKTYKEAVPATNKFRNAIKDQFKRADQNVKKFREEIEKTKASLKGYAKSFTTLQGLTNVFRNLLFVVRELARAFTLFVRKIIDVGVKFQESIERVSIIGDLTKQQTEDLEQFTRQLAATTSFTASQITESQIALAQAGFEFNQVLAATDASIKLAASSLSDLKKVTSLISSAVRIFNLDLDETVNTADIFSFAITNSKLTIESLTQSFKFGATAGASFGFTLEETVSAMAEFANIGLTGSLIGTNFRMALTFLTRDTKRSRDAFKRLTPTLETVRKKGNEFRLTLRDLSPDANNMADIISKLAQTNLTAADAIDIFGRRSGANIKNLVDRFKQGAVDIQKFTAAIGEATENKIIEEKFTRMQETLSARIKILRSAFQELAITMFQLFAGDFGETIDAIRNTVKELAKEVKNFPKNFPFISTIQEVFKSISENQNAIRELIINILSLFDAIFTLTISIAKLIIFLKDFLGILIKFFIISALVRQVVTFYKTINVLTNSLAKNVIITKLASATLIGFKNAVKVLVATLGRLGAITLAITALIGVVILITKLFKVWNKETVNQVNELDKLIEKTSRTNEFISEQAKRFRTLSDAIGITIKNEKQFIKLLEDRILLGRTAVGQIEALEGVLRVATGTKKEIDAMRELAQTSNISGESITKIFDQINKRVEILVNTTDVIGNKLAKNAKLAAGAFDSFQNAVNNVRTALINITVDRTTTELDTLINQFLNATGNVAGFRESIVNFLDAVIKDFSTMSGGVRKNTEFITEELEKLTTQFEKMGVTIDFVELFQPETAGSVLTAFSGLVSNLEDARKLFEEYDKEMTKVIENQNNLVLSNEKVTFSIGDVTENVGKTIKEINLLSEELDRIRKIGGRAFLLEGFEQNIGLINQLQKNADNLSESIKSAGERLRSLARDQSKSFAERLFLLKLQNDLLSRIADVNIKIRQILDQMIIAMAEIISLENLRLFLGTKLLEIELRFQKALTNIAAQKRDSLKSDKDATEQAINLVAKSEERLARESAINRKLSEQKAFQGIINSLYNIAFRAVENIKVSTEEERDLLLGLAKGNEGLVRIFGVIIKERDKIISQQRREVSLGKQIGILTKEQAKQQAILTTLTRKENIEALKIAIELKKIDFKLLIEIEKLQRELIKEDAEREKTINKIVEQTRQLRLENEKQISINKESFLLQKNINNELKKGVETNFELIDTLKEQGEQRLKQIELTNKIKKAESDIRKSIADTKVHDKLIEKIDERIRGLIKERGSIEEMQRLLREKTLFEEANNAEIEKQVKLQLSIIKAKNDTKKLNDEIRNQQIRIVKEVQNQLNVIKRGRLGEIENERNKLIDEREAKLKKITNKEERASVAMTLNRIEARLLGETLDEIIHPIESITKGLNDWAVALSKSTSLSKELTNVLGEVSNKLIFTPISEGLFRALDLVVEETDEMAKKRKKILDKLADDSAKIWADYWKRVAEIWDTFFDRLAQIEDTFQERFMALSEQRIEAEREYFELRRELREDLLTEEQDRLEIQNELQQALLEAELSTGEAQRIRLEEAKSLIQELSSIEKNLGFNRDQREAGSLAFLGQFKKIQDSNFRDRISQLAQEKQTEILNATRRRDEDLVEAARKRDERLAEAQDKARQQIEDLKAKEEVKDAQLSANQEVARAAIESGLKVIGAAVGEFIAKMAASRAFLGPAAIGIAVGTGLILANQAKKHLKKDGGFINYQKKAKGGYLVRGGGGNIDDIYKMLPQGSFVVNREATTKHRSELDRMALGFSGGGTVPVRITNGEYYVPPDVAMRNREKLMWINSDRKQGGGEIGIPSGSTSTTNINNDNRRELVINVDARGSSPDEDSVRELYNNQLRDLIQDDLENKEIVIT